MGGLVQPGKAAVCLRLRAARGIRGKLLCGPGKPGKLIMSARKCLQTCRGGPVHVYGRDQAEDLAGITCLWYGCLDVRTVRVILARDTAATLALVTTDLTASADA